MGHFLFVLIAFRMHGSQYKWPHMVESILSMAKTSKHIGHLNVPGRIGDGSLAVSFDDAVDFIFSLSFENDVSGMSHKSIVATVRNTEEPRDSVTKITSSSSSLTIGRTSLMDVSSMSTTLSVIKK